MDALTTTERIDLAACEADIAQGLEHFIAVGTALMRIQEGRLYRATDANFSAYCNRRWKISRGYAYRLIAACEVAKEVSPIGDIKPTNESQCRPLTELDTTAERQDAWREAVETAPTDDQGEPVVTAAHVAEVVERRKPAKKEKPAAVEDDEPVYTALETDRVQALVEIRDEITESFAPSPRRYDAVTRLNQAIESVRILQGE